MKRLMYNHIIFLRRSILLLLFLCLAYLNVKADIDTLDYIPHFRLYKVSDFNSDSIQDSLYIYKNEHNNYLPRVIIWGKPDTTQQYDTTYYNDFVDYTEIEYPDWDYIDGTFSVYDFNSNSIDDITFHIFGYIYDSTSTTRIDRSFILYGQDSLHVRSIISIDDLDSSQTMPIYITDIVESVHLTDTLVRDPSGILSYLIYGNSIPNQRPIIIDNDNVTELITFCNLYPNPADVNIKIELSNKSYRITSISIINVFGDKQRLRNCISDNNGISTVDVSHITGGYYIVCVETQNSKVFQIPLIIIH